MRESECSDIGGSLDTAHAEGKLIQFYRNIHCLTSEFHIEFHAKNRYRTNRKAMSAISIFQVKFNVAVNFS